MMQLLGIGLQLAGSVDARPLPLNFHVVNRCRPATVGEDVVVCGDRDPERYRLRPLPSGYERDFASMKAETSIGGGKLGVTTQQVMIGGVPSNRVMIGIKLPF